jgi:hypothetical protein
VGNSPAIELREKGEHVIREQDDHRPRHDLGLGAGARRRAHQRAEWFQKFNEKNLAFLYQEEKASGEGSTFFKLVNRENN